MRYPDNWQELRALALHRDAYSCRNCGRRASHVHHVVPLSRGGSNSLSNLVSLCGNCHTLAEPHVANTLKRRGGRPVPRESPDTDGSPVTDSLTTLVKTAEPGSLAALERDIPEGLMRVLELYMPDEAGYLRLAQKNPALWEQYLNEEVMSSPSEFRNFTSVERLAIERQFIEWLKRRYGVNP